MKIPYTFLLLLYGIALTFIYYAANPPWQFFVFAIIPILFVFIAVRPIMRLYAGSWAINCLKEVIQENPKQIQNIGLLRKISWIFPRNQDLRELLKSAERGDIDEELLVRINRAIPDLKKSADKRNMILLLFWVGAAGVGVICKLISFLVYHHH